MTVRRGRRRHVHEVVERGQAARRHRGDRERHAGRAGSAAETDVELADVARLPAERRRGLHVDPVRTVVEVEVVDVLRAEVDAERVVDLRERNRRALGLLAIDRQRQLRIVDAEGREQAADLAAVHRLALQLLRRARQRAEVAPPA